MRWLGRGVLVVTLFGSMAFADRANAEEQTPAWTKSIQTIAVPDDRPKDWPLTELSWIPWDRATFERMLSRHLPPPDGPRQPMLRRVRYSAVLSGETLAGGRLSAQLERWPKAESFLSLGTPTLAFEDLSWSGQPAVWGTGLDSRYWLKLPRESGELEGRWSARGRVLAEAVAFDLEFLPAAVTELEVQTERGQTITSDVGDVERLPDNSDETHSRWRISLGNQTRCRVVAAKEATPRVEIPTVLYEQDQTVVISQDELQIWQTFRPEVLGGEVRRLTVSLPRSVEIVAATYGETQPAPLKFERVPGEGPAAQLVVSFPDALRGRTLPFRLEGFVRRGVGESIALPQLAIEGGIWLQGRVDVTVSLPLELRSLRAPGFRQRLPATTRPEGEHLSFQQLAPRSQLVLNVERPAVERQARVLNLLDTSSPEWTLTAEIAWESQSGTVFEAACRLPEGWRVSNVTQLGGGPETELAAWDVRAHPESGQILHIEFPEGLTPGRVFPLRVLAQREVSPRQTPTQVPLVLPLDCESAEVLLLLDDKSSRFLSLPSDAFEPFDVAGASSVWNTLQPAWSMVLAQASQSARLLQFVQTDASFPVIQTQAGFPGDASARVDLAIEGQRVRERYELHLRREAAIMNEADFTLPRGVEGIVWSWDGLEDKVSLRPATRQTTGETLTVQLPASKTELTLVGERTVPLTDGYAVPLLLMPQHGGFQGTVVIRADLEGVYRRRAGDASSEAEEPFSSEPRQWTYRGDGGEWTIETRQRHVTTESSWTYELQSRLADETGEFDYHELTLASAERVDFDGCRFSLPQPAELITVILQEQTLAVMPDEAEYAIAGAGHSMIGKRLTITYRTPARSELLRGHHLLLVPSFPGQCAQFSWDVSVAPPMRLDDSLSGLTFLTSTPADDWWRRLLGPLGRPAAGTDATSTEPTVTRSFAVGMALPTLQHYITWNRNSLGLLAWVLLLACLPAGVWLRGRTGIWPRRVAGSALAAAACLAIFGPEGWNTAGGGIFSGLLIALLLPSEFWRLGRTPAPTTPDASASTEVFRRAAMPFVIWLIFSSSRESSQAQDEPAAKVPAEKYLVLLPVDRDQQPSSKLPVVYVSPALNEAMRTPGRAEAADPAQLISSAEYLVHFDERRRPVLKIRYVIERLAKDEAGELQIPLERSWRNGLDRAYVDGQQQAVTGSGEDEFLKVPCTNSADQIGSWRRHEVLLEIQLPATDPLQGDLRASLFPVLDSRWSWQSPEPLRDVDVPAARGAVTMSLDRRLCEAQLGGVRNLTFRRSKDLPLAAQEPRTELQLLQLLTLRPTLIQAAFRVDCRVLDGEVQRLEIQLPPGGVLRDDVRGYRVLAATVDKTSEAGTRVLIEFAEPHRQNFVLEGDYIVPRSSPDETINFPRMQVRCGLSPGGVKQLVAIDCDPEFSAQLVNLDDPAILQVRVEQFVALWGDTIPRQQAQFAFQLQEGGQPAFRLSPVRSDQQLLSWQEDVTVSRRKLDWVLTAELKSSAWPAQTFSLLLDRRLSIDSVSVREQGIEFPLRWSKTPLIGSSQNRVTIFLRREAASVSQLRIQGRIRSRPTSSVALPSVRFESPQTPAGVLTLSHEPGYRLELEGRQTDADPGAAPESKPESATHRFFKRLKIQEGDSNLAVRLERASDASRVQSLWLVDPEPSAWRLRGLMQLTPAEGTREIRVRLPNWLPADRLEAAGITPPPIEQTENGERVLLVHCPRDSLAPIVLKWEVEISPPSAPLKLPVVLHAEANETMAAVSAQEAWQIAHRGLAHLDAVSPLLREPLLADEQYLPSLCRVAGETLALTPTVSRPANDQSGVLRVEHLLEPSDEADWLGQTDLLPSPNADAVEIHWPEGLDVRSIFADGTALTLDEASRAARSWRVTQAGRIRRLSIRWTARTSPRGFAWAGQRTVPLPFCMQASSPATCVYLSDQNRQWILWPRDWRPRTRWESAVDRLELELQQQHEAAQSSADADRRLWKLYRQAEQILAAPSTMERLTREDRLRWAAIVAEMNQIETSPDTMAESTWDLSDLAVTRDMVAGGLDGDVSRLQCWIVRRDLVAWLAAAASFMLLARILPLFAGGLLHRWWKDRPHWAWLLFGVVWWACWTPKILGVAMIAWAALEWWRRRPALLPAVS